MAQCDDSARDEHGLLPFLGRVSSECLGGDGPVTVEPVYYGEVFTNARGGITTNGATQYEGLLDLAMTVELDKTQLPLPGRFFLLAQNTHGRGLTEDFIGDTQVLSNIDSGDNIMQVSEYWWEFGLLGDDVTLRLGKQDVNSEFLLVEMAEDFIQSSFGLSPSSAGLPTYPDPSMAAVLLSQLTDQTRLKLGIWDGLASGGSWGFSDNDVILLIGELEHKYSLDGGRLPGIFELGLAYNSDGIVDGEQFPSEWGYYLQWQQLVFRERPCDPADSQGLGIFALYLPRFGGGPVTASPLEVIEESAAAGFVYRGLLPGRDEDVIGAGIAWTQLNLGGTNRETVVETFYKAQVTDTVSVQPDIQYIASPSGIYDDALTVGLRFTVTP
ncbi:carbohydrate porin [Novipirellula herctigrandis]